MLQLIQNSKQEKSRFTSKSVKSSAYLFSLCCSTFISVSPALALDPNALPDGGQVVGGSANLDYVSPSELHVNQSSNRAVINWDSFNIGTDAAVAFHQPNAASVTVNRVTGNNADPTQILGAMSANGTVMVLDRNGVVFGKDSRVDVGGIIVSTGDVNTDDFMAGDASLVLSDVDSGGKIINEGQINVKQAGLAALVAPTVVNNGIIQAKSGRIQIGAATQATIDLYGDGLLELAVDETLSHALIENTGQINAESGTIHITASMAKGVVDTVINMDGVTSVASVTQSGGKIILEGANTRVSGVLDANGATGGGQILVGGEYQGGGTIRHADTVQVADTARISANATQSGNGGEIIVWSDKDTQISGVLEAKGGAQTGDGGFIETSSKKNLNVSIDTTIDVGAPNGKGGEWLLDPEDITISDSGNDGDANTSDVATATINATLNGGGDVTFITAGAGPGTGTIRLTNANIDMSVANGSARLKLEAIKDIIMTTSTINSSSGDVLNVLFNADRNADQSGQISISGSTISTSGGYFVAGGGSGTLDSDANGILGDAGTGADMVAAYGNATVDDGIYISNSTINTGAGDIVLTGHGYDLIDTNYLVGINGSNADLETTSGDIILRGTGGAGNVFNHGVWLTGSGTQVESNTGSVVITGVSNTDVNADGNNNYGVHIQNGATIESTGTGGSAATITIDGTSAAAFSGNIGVYIEGTDTQILSVDGDIDITGTSLGTTTSNHGILISDTAHIESNGTDSGAAKITLDGTSGNGTSSNYGVYIKDADTKILTGYGDVSITAVGRGSVTDNHGVYMDGASIESSGYDAIDTAAQIILDGTGGAGSENNNGVRLINESVISSNDGDIDITGTGRGSGVSVEGVLLVTDNSILSNGNANIIITGSLAGPGTGSDIRTLGGANIIGGGSSTGDITFNGNTFDLLETNILTTQDIYVLPTLTSTTIGLGGGSGTLNLTDAELDLFNAGGKLVIGLEGTGTGVVDINTWDLSSKTHDVEVYGWTTDIGGLIMGTGDFLSYAQSNVYTAMSFTGGSITRSVAGTSTLDLRANGGIFLNAGDDITATNGALNIIINPNRDDNVQGMADIRNVTLNSNGGDIIIGGGTDPLNTPSRDFRGSYLSAAILTAGAGDISIRGEANTGTNNYWQGVAISGSTIQTTTGDITLYGKSQTTGDNSQGIQISGSTIQTDSGTVDITGIAQENNAANYGVWFSNADVIITGSGDFNLYGESQVDDIYLNATSDIGSVTASGDFIFNVDDFISTGGTIKTGGDVTIKPRTSTTTIGLGGGSGGLNLTDTELGYFTVGGRFIIGDSAAGTGDIDLDSWDYAAKAYSVELYGGDIDIGGVTMGTGSLFAYARDGADDSDITVSAAITRAVDGDATVELRADQNIVVNAAITATDANSDADADATTSPDRLTVILNSDRDNDEVGAINISTGGITTLGGDITMGGGTNPTSDYAVAAEDGVFDIGVNMNVAINAGGGNISIYGKGDDVGNSNSGVYTAYDILTNNAGTITLNGIGGGGSASNYGVYIGGGGTEIQSEDGGILITAQGGGDGSGISNGGLLLDNGADLLTTGAGTIDVYGTGGLGTSSANRGIYSSNGSSRVETVSGDILLDGTGGTGSVGLQAAGTVHTANAADIELRSTGQLTLTSTNIQTDDGDITLNGDSVRFSLANVASLGSGDININAQSSMIAFSTVSTYKIEAFGGDINIVANNYSTSGAGSLPIIAHVGDITFKPYSTTTSIGLGGGAGGLNLTDAELATFSAAGRLIIGDSAAGTGDIDLNSWDLSSTTYDVELYGGDIDIGGVTMGTGSLFAYARDGADDSDITVSAAITRAVDGDATVELRADQSIFLQAAGDIIATDANSDADADATTSPDRLTVVLNADRDGDQNGAISVLGDITSLGGDITMGGGTSPLTTWAYGSVDGITDHGVDLDNVAINSGAGSITIFGKGEATSTNNHGIYIHNGTTLDSTSGLITLNGEGGTGGGAGVFFDNASVLTADTGAIDLDGMGTGGSIGVYLANGAVVQNTGAGAGDINVTGTSNSGAGVYIRDQSSSIHTADADIIIDAESLGAGAGLYLLGYASTTNMPSIFAGGAGNITITADSATGDGLFTNEFTKIQTTGTGFIDIDVSGNRGMYLRRADILANSGDLYLTAISSGSDTYLIDKQVTLRSSSGDFDLVANNAIRFTNTAALVATNGDFNITANDIQTTSGSPTFSAGNNLTLKPYDSARTIGLGSGAGGLNLTNSELSRFSAGNKFTIGDSASGTGAVTIDGVDLSAKTYDMEIYGGDITVSSGGFDSANSLLMIAQGDITMNGDISATGTGSSVVLVGDTFTNTAGAIDAGAGRYLVYGNGLSDITFGGLTASGYYGRAYNTDPPASIASGNHFVYQAQPTLTVTADAFEQITKASPVFTYTATGLHGSDLLAQVFSGSPLLQQGAKLTANTYSINASIGSMTSLSGYLFSFTPGILTLNIPLPVINTTQIDRQLAVVGDGFDFGFGANSNFNGNLFQTQTIKNNTNLNGLINFVNEYDSFNRIETFTSDDDTSAEQFVIEHQAISDNEDSNCLVANGAKGGCVIGG